MEKKKGGGGGGKKDNNNKNNKNNNNNKPSPAKGGKPQPQQKGAKASPQQPQPQSQHPQQQSTKGGAKKDKNKNKNKDGEKEDDGKKRMRTSKEVYDRINWDKSKDKSRFSVGYEDRFFGMKEIPFLEFSPGGETPWHRIHYFKEDGKFVWDRRTRTDLIFNTGDNENIDIISDDIESRAIPRKHKAARMRKLDKTKEAHADNEEWKKKMKEEREKAGFLNLPCYRYDSSWDKWVEANRSSIESVQKDKLIIVTWNVMFDIYDSEKIFTDIRNPLLLKMLAESNADIIGLQEVTKSFLQKLMAEEWVKENYYISDGPSASTIEPYGQVILSKIPIHKLSIFRFSERDTSKRVVVGEFILNGRIVYLPVIHLTSNHQKSETVKSKRQQQLNKIFQQSCPSGEFDEEDDGTDCIMMGDFNFGDDKESKDLLRSDFLDVWKVVYPNDAGFTYDPQTNSIAAISSKTGKRGRYDKILVRSKGFWLPLGVGLLGNEAYQEGIQFHEKGVPEGLVLFPSDHFGVRAELLYIPDGWANQNSEQLLLESQQKIQSERGTKNEKEKEKETEKEKEKEEEQEEKADETVKGVVGVVPPVEIIEAIRGAIEKVNKLLAAKICYPHVALLAGLLKESCLVGELPSTLSFGLANIDPFIVKLEKFLIVDDGQEGDLCLSVKTKQVSSEEEEDSQEFEILKAVLEASMPVLANTNSEGFPSLSICELKTKEEKENLRKLLDEIQKDWKAKEFLVDGVQLLALTQTGLSKTDEVKFQETDEDQQRREKGKEKEKRSDKGKEKEKEKEIEKEKEKVVEKGKEKETEKEQEKEKEKEKVKEQEKEKRVVPSEGSIEDVLNALKLFPSAEEDRRREEALAILEDLCIASIWPDKPASFKMVHTLGSYRLGVHSPTSDIDALCISYLQPKQFFEKFEEYLKRPSGKGKDAVKIINIAADALVPIMQLEVAGIQVDLLPCAYNKYVPLVSPAELSNSQVEKLDDGSIKSIQGCRDAGRLLSSVPSHLLTSFRTVLKAIKLWSDARGLNSNGRGFLGGFSWTVLVAWIFNNSSLKDQTFESPEKASFAYLKEFFQVYSSWKWQTSIVSLGKEAEKKYEITKTDKMAILTPTPPYRNSARNVSDSTLKIIVNELQRANNMMNTIEAEGKGWDNLLRPINFFQLYPTYLQIDFCALTEKDLNTCMGWMDSRCIVLTLSVEQLQAGSVYVHPYVGSIVNLIDRFSSGDADEDKNTHQSFPWMGTFYLGVFHKVSTKGPGGSATSSSSLDLRPAFPAFLRQFDEWDRKPNGCMVTITEVAKNSAAIKRAKNAWNAK